MKESILKNKCFELALKNVGMIKQSTMKPSSYQTSLCFGIFFFLLNALQAQRKTVEYSRDFSFREGVYLSLTDFKNNNPIPSSRIVFSTNRGDRDFLKYVLNKKVVTYIDSTGKQQEIESEKIWGYSSNDMLYIKYGVNYNRVAVVGSLCHFIATTQTVAPFRNPYPYNRYDPTINQVQYIYTTNQHILDFETGVVQEFNVLSMETLLKRDEVLYNEFVSLSKRKKKESVFIFLRKYNDRHPIYFPE
jgi:hypothetical protein